MSHPFARERLLALVHKVQVEVHRLRQRRLAAVEARQRRERSRPAAAALECDTPYGDAYCEHLQRSIDAQERPKDSVPQQTQRPRKKHLGPRRKKRAGISAPARARSLIVDEMNDLGRSGQVRLADRRSATERWFPLRADVSCRRITSGLHEIYEEAHSLGLRKELGTGWDRAVDTLGELRGHCRSLQHAIEWLKVRHFDPEDLDAWGRLDQPFGDLLRVWADITDRGMLLAGEQEEVVVLTESDRKILRALSQRQDRVYGQNLYVPGVGETKTKRRLRFLEHHGLVDRAYGRRSGWAITTEGRKYVAAE